MARDKIKMRLMMWGVLGLALFHLVFGSDRFYPFLHWSMFSSMEHEPNQTVYERTVLIAVDEKRVEHIINLPPYFTGWARADQPGRLIQRDYYRRMRDGDIDAAYELASLIEENNTFGDVIELRIETRRWIISDAFRSGTLRLNANPLPPDETEIEVLFPLDTSDHANGLN